MVASYPKRGGDYAWPPALPQRFITQPSCAGAAAQPQNQSVWPGACSRVLPWRDAPVPHPATEGIGARVIPGSPSTLYAAGMRPRAILGAAVVAGCGGGAVAAPVAPVARAPSVPVASTPSPGSSAPAPVESAAPDDAATCLKDVEDAPGHPLVIETPFNEPDFTAGESRELRVGYVGPASFDPFHVVHACVSWSVDPPDAAKVDADGRLQIAPTAAGKTLTVTATRTNGAVVTRTIQVVASRVAGIVGNWSEDAWLPCGSTTWAAPPHPIRELHLAASGDLSVTWSPFESYVDYWGSYVWDPATSAITLTVTGGNYVPPDLRTHGTASAENGALVLRGVWLGSALGAGGMRACAQRFKRQ
jgi:hypothetical protein